MIDSLIFSVGGVDGLSYIGCLKALEECDELENVKTIIGCSSGAIISCLIVLGFKSNEIENITSEIDFGKLININIEDFVNIDEDLGLENGEKLLKLISLFISHKTGKVDITFKELYNLTKIKLVIGSVCLNTECLEYFEHENSPDMSISLAIRMSCSIPILFTPVEYKNKLYVDGGLLGRYPIHNKYLQNTNCCLGFKIIHDVQKSYILSKLNFGEYIHYIFGIMFNKAQLFEHTNNENITTINIHPFRNTYCGFSFDVSNEDKKRLIQIGYDETRKSIIELRLSSYHKLNYFEQIISNCLIKKKIIQNSQCSLK